VLHPLYICPLGFSLLSSFCEYAEAHHRFTPEEQDWGFTRFVDLKKLFAQDVGRARAIIENDETLVTAFVRVLKDPTGVLWHNWHK
jgi:ubiquitin carboxyl-terminal hydrolase 7